MHVINKINLPDFFYNQLIQNLSIVVFAIYLTINNYTPLRAIISIGILYFYSYFVHILLHKFPNTVINLHTRFHHINTPSIVYKYVYLFIELISNIGFFIIFYILQRVTHINFVPNILIFYYGFIYSSIHIINYSIFHLSEKHIDHHKTSDIDYHSTKNYGPDFLDHLFGTNGDNKFENYNHVLPNILISFFISYYIFK